MCEVGCGEGTILTYFAKLFPRATFKGVDLDSEVVKQATQRADAEKLSNITCVERNMYDLPKDFSTAFDVVLIADAFHDLPDIGKALDTVKAILKPSGILVVIDFNNASAAQDNLDNPVYSMLCLASMGYCIPCSYYHGGDKSDVQGETMGVENIVTAINKGGFTISKQQPLNSIQMNIAFLCKPN